MSDAVPDPKGHPQTKVQPRWRLQLCLAPSLLTYSQARFDRYSGRNWHRSLEALVYVVMMGDPPHISMDFADVEALVRASLEVNLGVAISSEVRDGDLCMTLTRDLAQKERNQVTWKVFAGLEVFSFWFDGRFWAIDFDYDVAPGDKAELVTDWVRLIESYFRGEGRLSERRTLFRRRRVQELALGLGNDRRILTDR